MFIIAMNSIELVNEHKNAAQTYINMYLSKRKGVLINMNLILIRPRNILKIPINEGNQTVIYMIIDITRGL